MFLTGEIFKAINDLKYSKLSEIFHKCNEYLLFKYLLVIINNDESNNIKQ